MKQSTGDTYILLNLMTNRVTDTRNVKWAFELFGSMKRPSEEQDNYYTVSEEKEDIDRERERDRYIYIYIYDRTEEDEYPRQSNRIKTRREIEAKVTTTSKKLDNLVMSATALWMIQLWLG